MMPLCLTSPILAGLVTVYQQGCCEVIEHFPHNIINIDVRYRIDTSGMKASSEEAYLGHQRYARA